ncbi:hypothetical protein ADUPG1_007055 [Aduncisulcus paluster]|uniref:HAT C-terminal dimerisation domain-containing protein n=1 Tax=Aduncisulcus paluster TaxID=2918883 RepID=A0ABQ5KKJ6_9EUKA|nr:hypothetical protein ADUPG1_007055 [Aduncisulcus paluster]
MISNILTKKFRTLMFQYGVGPDVPHSTIVVKADFIARNMREGIGKTWVDEPCSIIIDKGSKYRNEVLAIIAVNSRQESTKIGEIFKEIPNVDFTSLKKPAPDEIIKLSAKQRKVYDANLIRYEEARRNHSKVYSLFERRLRSIEKEKPGKLEIYKKIAKEQDLTLRLLVWNNTQPELEKLLTQYSEATSEDKRKKKKKEEEKEKTTRGKEMANQLIKIFSDLKIEPTFIVTDGEALMQNVAKRLCDDKKCTMMKNIWCLAHQLDLLIGDFFKTKRYEFIPELITTISYYQKHRKQLLSSYRIKSVTKCLTRWVENVDCILDIQLNWLYYEAFCVNFSKDTPVAQKNIEQMFSDNHNNVLTKFTKVLVPLSDAIRSIQGTDVKKTVGEINDILTLIDRLIDDEKPKQYESRKQKIRIALEVYEDVKAFLPDLPRDEKKSQEELLAILRKYHHGWMLDDIDSEDVVAIALRRCLQEFIDDTALDLSTLNNDVKRKRYDEYWKKKGGAYKFVKPLLTVPLSGAEVERYFSAYGSILTPQRSRLGNERTTKYTDIKITFRKKRKERLETRKKMQRLKKIGQAKPMSSEKSNPDSKNDETVVIIGRKRKSQTKKGGSPHVIY